MKSATLRLLTGLISAAAAVWSFGTPLKAGAANRFNYKLEVTPEEEHVDPSIDRRYTAAFAGCQNRAQTTSENATCFEAEFQRQDAKLNATWRTTLRRLPPGERPLLVQAQREWVAERDPFCMKDADGFSGGTIAPVVYVGCRVELTIRRMIWLEQLR